MAPSAAWCVAHCHGFLCSCVTFHALSRRGVDHGRKRGFFVIAAISAARYPCSMWLEPRRVAMVVYPDVQLLDVTGPLEVFARTARWLVEQGRCRQPAYTVELLAEHPGIVRSSSGLELVV